MMKHKMLATFLLGCLFVMIARGNSSARVILGQKGTGNKLYVTGITSTFSQKGPIDATGAAHMRKLGIGGKKLMAHEEASMESKNEKRGRGGGTSKLSGVTYFDGICDFERKGDSITVKCKADKTSTPRKFNMIGFVTFTVIIMGLGIIFAPA